MSQVPSLAEGQVEALAKVLGECGTGSDISRVLNDRGLVDNSGESTKWRRIYWVFLDTQRKYGCANQVLDFTRAFLTPARFVGRTEVFEERRSELNTILAFSGLEFGADGQFRQRDSARTLDEAERRLRTIRGKFKVGAYMPKCSSTAELNSCKTTTSMRSSKQAKVSRKNTRYVGI